MAQPAEGDPCQPDGGQASRRVLDVVYRLDAIAPVTTILVTGGRVCGIRMLSH
jgi:hypothetical protein